MLMFNILHSRIRIAHYQHILRREKRLITSLDRQVAKVRRLRKMADATLEQKCERWGVPRKQRQDEAGLPAPKTRSTISGRVAGVR